MSRREWSCRGCHAMLGRVTIDRAGRHHLHLLASRVAWVRPERAETWDIMCQCGRIRAFTGYQVHIEDDRDEAA